MKYNGIVISIVAITLLNAGCVKPTEEVNRTKNTNSTVYNEQPNEVVYTDSQPIVYGDPTTSTTTSSSGGGVYSSGGGGSSDGTVITTTDSYQPVVTTTPPSASDHYEPSSRGGGGYSSSSSRGGGAYSTPSSSGGYSSSGGGSGAYSDPYSSGSSGGGGGYAPLDDPYSSSSSSSSSSTYSTDIPYGSTPSAPSSSSSYGGGKKGIQLQVAALKDYYAAEEFRKGLSLDPKYGSYVKRGAMNKVIITGIPTRSEAKRLAARQFPGAFIVGGTETTPSYTPPASSYTPPTSSSPANTNSGIGVQVGAFSTKSKARAVAQEKAGGEYTAVVKTVKVRGRTMYKAILLGFASRAEAKRVIASGRFGDAFVVSGIHP
jgi:cell division septation protein DedD